MYAQKKKKGRRKEDLLKVRTGGKANYSRVKRIGVRAIASGPFHGREKGRNEKKRTAGGARNREIIPKKAGGEIILTGHREQ